MNPHASDGDAQLMDLVRRHRMTWESHPELAVSNGDVRPIGFTVELHAVHDHPVHPPSPGCPECAPVREALLRICKAVLPKGEHASWYEVHVGGAFEMEPRRAGAPELVARIEILHQGTVNRPPDECERACLAEIKASLTRLGVQQGRWTKPRN
jgi:hypothetical protein